MTIRNRLAISALALAASAGVASANPLIVTSVNDAGDGSLRAALQIAAETLTASQIFVATDDDITIDSALVYSGTAPLTLVGNGQSIITSANVDVLAVTNGADLTVSSLTFAGPGGFDIQNRGDLAGAAGKGIFVDVRDDQTGTVTVHLSDVTVADVAGHGIHISDCTLADDCGGGGGGAGQGSAASIAVTLTNVTVSNVGNGRFDADGLRVDERGDGSIIFASTGSLFERVGADGVELDEGQAGDVQLISRNDVFRDNGGYCDPAVLTASLPDMVEAEFEDGAVTDAFIPGPVTGSADDRCVEREVSYYDSGSVAEFALGLDLDDGFDVDEAGPGSIEGIMIGGTIAGNLDEGLDFDEEDGGNIAMAVWTTTADGNTDDEFKYTEQGNGDVHVTLQGVTASDNGGKGAVFEEEDGGNILIDASGVITGNNDDSDDTGIEVYQDGSGSGVLRLDASDITDGVDSSGVQVVSG